LKQFRGAAGEHASANFYAMVQLRVIQHLHYGLNRSCFGIVGTINQAFDASVHHRAGTHGARFNRDKQIAVRQAMVVQRHTCVTQGHYLSMGGWIVVGDVVIPSAANDAALMHDYRADWNLTGFQRPLGGAQGLLHPEFVILPEFVVGC
jgi:hypothetical protein